MFGLTLTSWLPLLFIPIIGSILYYLYKKKKDTTVLTVGTTFLLSKISTSISSRKKVKLPLRFWLEMFIFCLLLLSMAAPFIKRDSEKIALLIDNSFSMRAHDKSSLSEIRQTSRFDTAILKAKDFVSSLDGTVQLSVYKTSPFLERLTIDTGIQDALESLSTISSGFDGVRLTEALKGLQADNQFSSYHLYTDHMADSQASTTSNSEPEAIVIHTIGERSSNIALTAEQLSDSQISYTLHSFSDEPVRGVTSLFGLDESNQESLIAQQDFAFSPNDQDATGEETKNSVFNLESKTYKEYKVEISLQDGFDALLEDNTVTFNPMRSQGNLILVSPAKKNVSLLELPTIETQRYSSNEYLQLLKSGKIDAPVIFHQTVPTQLPTQNFVFVNPKRKSSLFTFEEDSSLNQSIIDWNTLHPLTRYVQFSQLRFSKLSVITPPLWAQPLAHTKKGVVLAAGKYKQHRSALIGFELFPYTGEENRSLSVLTLNLVQWLLQSTIETSTSNYFNEEESDLRRSPTVSIDPLIATSDQAQDEIVALRSLFLKAALFLLLLDILLLAGFLPSFPRGLAKKSKARGANRD